MLRILIDLGQDVDEAGKVEAGKVEAGKVEAGKADPAAVEVDPAALATP